MYGRLLYVRQYVFRNHDALYDKRVDDSADDDYASGLHSSVPDGMHLHDAALDDGRESVHDVRRDVHVLRQLVRKNGGR
jgi:hypothetical protein